MARGDSSAVAELYDRHARALYSLALRMLSDVAEAEDVVQDVFTQAWRQAGRYDPARAPVIGWLLVITRARALDRLRARRSRIAPAPLEVVTIDPVDPGPGQELQAIGNEEAARLRQPLGTVKTRMRTALQKLREALR